MIALRQLRALLGEADVVSGRIDAPRTLPDAIPVAWDETERTWTTSTWLNESVAYAPQQSFIRHGSILDNILFGQPMWRERYEQCLAQAALLPDLELLQDGDLTEVGEKGVTLASGASAQH